MDRKPDRTTVVEYSAGRGLVLGIQHSVVSKPGLQISSSSGIRVGVPVGVGVGVDVEVGVDVLVGVDV